jgi:hypothetical protein
MKPRDNDDRTKGLFRSVRARKDLNNCNCELRTGRKRIWRSVKVPMDGLSLECNIKSRHNSYSSRELFSKSDFDKMLNTSRRKIISIVDESTRTEATTDTTFQDSHNSLPELMGVSSQDSDKEPEFSDIGRDDGANGCAGSNDDDAAGLSAVAGTQQPLSRIEPCGMMNQIVSLLTEDLGVNTPMERKVHWGDVTISQHEIILGDNPAVSSGPPVTISWQAFDTVTLPIDIYEAGFAEQPRARRTKEQILIPKQLREDWIRQSSAHGASRREIKEVVAAMDLIRKQRQQSAKDANGFGRGLIRKLSLRFHGGATDDVFMRSKIAA